MIIRFVEYGESLGTRFLGEKIRMEVINNFNIAERIVFDLEGVDLLSNSFADECFGKLVESFGIEVVKRKTTFKNAKPIVVAVIKKAIDERLNSVLS